MKWDNGIQTGCWRIVLEDVYFGRWSRSVYREMIFEQRPELNEGVKPHKDLGRTFQAVEISSAKALG